MALTEFGKEIRKARLDVGENISTMAQAMKRSPAFLSAIETGAKKVPMDILDDIQNFFAERGRPIKNLRPLAEIANQSVSLEGLSPRHQMLVAGFARKNWDDAVLENMARLLESAQKGNE